MFKQINSNFVKGEKQNRRSSNYLTGLFDWHCLYQHVIMPIKTMHSVSLCVVPFGQCYIKFKSLARVMVVQLK